MPNEGDKLETNHQTLAERRLNDANPPGINAHKTAKFKSNLRKNCPSKSTSGEDDQWSPITPLLCEFPPGCDSNAPSGVALTDNEMSVIHLAQSQKDDQDRRTSFFRIDTPDSLPPNDSLVPPKKPRLVDLTKRSSPTTGSSTNGYRFRFDERTGNLVAFLDRREPSGDSESVRNHINQGVNSSQLELDANDDFGEFVSAPSGITQLQPLSTVASFS